MWHDVATGRVNGELSTLDGSVLASVDFLPVTDLSGQTPISSLSIATQEYTWQYVDNASLSSTPVNAPPVAEAGANVVINSADQSLKTIQGAASDPDNNALQYRCRESIAHSLGQCRGWYGSPLLNVPAFLWGSSLTLR
jgi:hypothetical protein